MRIRHQIATVTATVCLTVAGCKVASNESEDSSQVDAARDAIPASVWTAGILDGPRPDAPATTLVAVHSATHDGFDRTVFEFSERIPGYHTEYIDRPVRQCGSGQVTEIAGDGWLEVRMYPVHAHTEAGRPAVAERERMPGLPVLAELELTCDFEAVVTWVLGVDVRH